jgi:hypothetical protein
MFREVTCLGNKGAAVCWNGRFRAGISKGWSSALGRELPSGFRGLGKADSAARLGDGGHQEGLARVGAAGGCDRPSPACRQCLLSCVRTAIATMIVKSHSYWSLTCSIVRLRIPTLTDVE